MASEVKRLLEEIEASYQAARHALTSPAIMAKHEFIQRRMEEIEIAHEKIRSLLGNEYTAMDLVVKTLAEIEEKS
ncbi:MAG TPA: hypothetical protein VFV38_43170 [Ktedonobacteraceae bacterium]|nr:hypothetical protein [Ktedonobacteraceae bacterium]